MRGSCAGHPEPLWDAYLDDETEVDRHRRHTRALAICRVCPIRAACAAGVDLKHDDGVRGYMVLPTIQDSERRSWREWAPGRGGLAAILTRLENAEEGVA